MRIEQLDEQMGELVWDGVSKAAVEAPRCDPHSCAPSTAGERRWEDFPLLSELAPR